MDRWAGRAALVTGASEGIGAAICRALVRHGMHVVGCARNIKKLQAAAQDMVGPGHFLPVQCNVSKEEEVLKMFDIITDKYGGADVIVNNAGVALPGFLFDGDTEAWREMLEVNVLGVCIVTREAIKSFRSREVEGHIINLSSMGAHRVPPLGALHFYSATKHALRALTQGMRMETREDKRLHGRLRITDLSPGVVHTEIHRRCKGEELAEAAFNSMTPLQPKDMADDVIFMLSLPQHVTVLDMLVEPTDC